MSAPPADVVADQEMEGSGDEGEGDAVMAGVSDDSSEEEQEDEEALRNVQEGFIVGEEDDEEGDDEEEERRKRRKRKKKRHAKRREEQEEALEDDDLDLLEENTGGSFKKPRLSRLRRRSASPVASSSKRKSYVDSSEDDLDNDDLMAVPAPDIQNIWDDDNRAHRDEDDEDMDSFIETDEEAGDTLDEQAREAKRQERKRVEKERWKSQGGRANLAGIDAGAWDEIHDVFGDGHEYDWALAGEDEEMEDDQQPKVDMRYQDVFEPSVIRARMLTEDDDLIRAQDIPERMQLASSALSSSSTLSLQEPLEDRDLNDASLWVTQRISSRKTREFFNPDGPSQHLQAELVLAVSSALRFLFIDEFEVPYVWTHKRDYISSTFDPQLRTELITLTELWRIYTLGQKYKSLLKRKKALTAAYERLGISNEYYETEIDPKIDSVEVVADVTEWLAMMFKEKKHDGFAFSFHDDEEQPETVKHKMPSRTSAYEVAKKSPVYKLAQGFGIQPHEVVLNFVNGDGVHFIDDPELNAIAYADQFADPDPEKAQPPEELLQRARMILATELGKDPVLRKHVRALFKEEALISVEPTERGITKIDQHHAYYNFKYLQFKDVKDMLESSQFLHILAAESELLVTVQITLPTESLANFEQRLREAFSSDGFSDSARAWNEERAKVVKEAMEQHLLPAGVKWTREYIREEVEDTLATELNLRLRNRIDVAPYHTPHMKLGETASVLACSWGKGDHQRDAITIVFMDEVGRMREHTKIDNLTEGIHRDEFLDMIKRRRPDVIVVGGFTMATLKLTERIREVVKGTPMNADGSLGDANDYSETPIIYVFDDIARLYQHSKRAADEFGALSPIAKYCVALARYTQSPLNEYAALGSDITTISFDEEDQHLIPVDKLLFAFERALVDITNKVGVDINRAIGDDYYRHLLPFICGLGPRKAQLLVQKIENMGGNLVNRDQFVRESLLTTKIFLNAAAFLRIQQDEGDKPLKGRHTDDNVQDPLDDTRIHPEDYELARKMATDALELDDEDVHDDHPSHVISLIMHDDDNEKKLAELNLDEFAVSLLEANDTKKRHALDLIREELLRPFAEYRAAFPLPTAWEVLTMLSGETTRTLRPGLIVSVQVTRAKQDTAFVRLDSGVEGIIKSSFVADITPNDVSSVLKKHQTLPALVMDVQMDLPAGQFLVELSSRESEITGGDSSYRRVRHDGMWNHTLAARHQDLQDRKKRSEVNKARRVIKHPNFHNFNSMQAEAYLDTQPVGDVVIRPSSKGVDHLAVTWKVDEKLYQHIDVTEPNADPTGQTMGRELIVDADHRYADLDELIVTHVQVMARRVEDLKAHAKFIPGPEEELHLFLKNQLAANPGKSMYGFSLNRKKAGHFNLCFLANKNSVVQTWPVRVTPEAYYLFEAPAPGVPELCDAFKVRHLHQSQNVANAANGGKTPYGAGGRTPRAGGATPGRMSVRQVAQTPNPYTAQQSPAASVYGAATPGPSASYGFQTPSHHPPPAIPAGIHPSRAALIQSQGPWQSGGSATWR